MGNKQKVAMVGLGIIGKVWAAHYERAGILGASWNRTPKKDAPGFEAKLEEIPRRVDALHVAVADPSAVEGILNVILPNLKPGQLVIQSSTIDPDSSRRFEKRVEDKGCHYLEAPFTGSKPAAEEQKTVFYLGGKAELVAFAEPYLKHLSQDRFVIGTAAQAASIKLAMNLQLAIMMEALSESLTFSRSAGIPDDLYFRVLEKNAGYSPLAKLKEPKLKAGDYAPQFSIKHMWKDLRLTLAAKVEKKLPLTEAVEKRFALASEKGFADSDYSALIRLL